jgi:hypothetical protein
MDLRYPPLHYMERETKGVRYKRNIERTMRKTVHNIQIGTILNFEL